MLGDCPDHPRARGLSRLSLCSGTVQTTIMLGDCLDHHRAQRLFRPLSCSGRSRSPSFSGTKLTTVILGVSSFTYASLGDCPDRSPRLHKIGTRIQLSGIYFFSLRPCYKAHTSPSSKLGDYISTMHLPVHLVSPVRRLDSQLNWEFFLDPSTTCLRYLLPGLGTKWAHFTSR